MMFEFITSLFCQNLYAQQICGPCKMHPRVVGPELRSHRPEFMSRIASSVDYTDIGSDNLDMND